MSAHFINNNSGQETNTKTTQRERERERVYCSVILCPNLAFDVHTDIINAEIVLPNTSI